MLFSFDCAETGAPPASFRVRRTNAASGDWNNAFALCQHSFHRRVESGSWREEYQMSCDFRGPDSKLRMILVRWGGEWPQPST